MYGHDSTLELCTCTVIVAPCGLDMLLRIVPGSCTGGGGQLHEGGGLEAALCLGNFRFSQCGGTVSPESCL